MVSLVARVFRIDLCGSVKVTTGDGESWLLAFSFEVVE
jgi:hypothetical protein